MQDSFDLSAVDCEGFISELDALRKELDRDLGEADLAHLRKVERWGRACTAIGMLTAGICPNPLSAVLLALGRNTRWVIMHHVGHRGYDRVPDVPPRYTSKVFARGRRRFLDWGDWSTPASWVYEHNVLHHSHTGELRDPDLIEQNTELVRSFSKALRYASMAFLSLVWRPAMYAPSAFRLWKTRFDGKHENAGHYDFQSILRSLFDRDYLRRAALPYGALQFVVLPLLYAPLGMWGVFSAWCNFVGAEMVANLQSFTVIWPNHAGDDLYRYDASASSRNEARIRQIISSANYATGSDGIDWLQMWLNYQIEHHLWPDLPMLRYREVQPKVKALCAKYGIPYVQESLLRRLGRMVDVVVGNTSMRWSKAQAKDANPGLSA